jgi:hypothetical protein
LPDRDQTPSSPQSSDLRRQCDDDRANLRAFRAEVKTEGAENAEACDEIMQPLTETYQVRVRITKADKRRAGEVHHDHWETLP